MCADAAVLTDYQIFSYEANDLSKGWEITAAYLWPKDMRAEIGGSDGHLANAACLATDVCNYTQANDITNASDNRQCGWIQQGYQMRHSSTADFLGTAGGPPVPSAFILDPQTIVSTNLYLNFTSINDFTTNPDREWCYMVILKPKKMNPSDSILQIIKSTAQDVSN